MPETPLQDPQSADRGAPLVTVGIPAHNRPGELERAARSALAQEGARIEVLVSDDASSDPEVERVAARLAADPRVRVARQPRNLGHAANYQWLLESARGEYFMWLSDDDWIDPSYVARCLAVLRADAETVLACGRGRYYQGRDHVIDERDIDLVSDRPGQRLLRYFARVSANGALFGLARREDLLRTGFPAVLGGDWLLVAGLAARGRVRTVPGVYIHRSMSGLGSDPRALAADFGITGLAARRHHVAVAAQVWRTILAGAPPFDAMRWLTRLTVSSAAAALILARFTFVDALRGMLGPRLANRLEHEVAAWLRKREGR